MTAPRIMAASSATKPAAKQYIAVVTGGPSLVGEGYAEQSAAPTSRWKRTPAPSSSTRSNNPARASVPIEPEPRLQLFICANRSPSGSSRTQAFAQNALTWRHGLRRQKSFRATTTQLLYFCVPARRRPASPARNRNALPTGEKMKRTDRHWPDGGLCFFRGGLWLHFGACKRRRTGCPPRLSATRPRRIERGSQAFIANGCGWLSRERRPQGGTLPAADGRRPRRRFSDDPDRNRLTWPDAVLWPIAADRGHPGDHCLHSKPQAVNRKPVMPLLERIVGRCRGSSCRPCWPAWRRPALRMPVRSNPS